MNIDEKEFRAAKARIAYKGYIARQPRCNKCEYCMFVGDRKNMTDRRVCTKEHEIIDNRVLTSPRWCPKRK